MLDDSFDWWPNKEEHCFSILQASLQQCSVSSRRRERKLNRRGWHYCPPTPLILTYRNALRRRSGKKCRQAADAPATSPFVIPMHGNHGVIVTLFGPCLYAQKHLQGARVGNHFKYICGNMLPETFNTYLLEVIYAAPALMKNLPLAFSWMPFKWVV